jgi:hypothetical protein
VLYRASPRRPNRVYGLRCNHLLILNHRGRYRNKPPGRMPRTWARMTTGWKGSGMTSRWKRRWMTTGWKGPRLTRHTGSSLATRRPPDPIGSPEPTDQRRLPESATPHGARPKPADAGVEVPCTAVISHPAPRIAGYPRPAESRVPYPPAMGIGRPSRPRVRRPAESAAGKRHPFAISVKFAPTVARSHRTDRLVFCRQ